LKADFEVRVQTKRLWLRQFFFNKPPSSITTRPWNRVHPRAASMAAAAFLAPFSEQIMQRRAPVSSDASPPQHDNFAVKGSSNDFCVCVTAWPVTEHLAVLNVEVARRRFRASAYG